jgi:hypothetical protein
MPPLRSERGVKRAPGGGQAETPRRLAAVAETRAWCWNHGEAAVDAGLSATSHRNKLRTGSSTTAVGIQRDTLGKAPDSPSLNTRSSSEIAEADTCTASADKASTLAGRALMRKQTHTTAQ